METGKRKSQLSPEGRDVGEGESPQLEEAGGDGTELLSQFSQEGIALIKKESSRSLKLEDLTPGLQKSLRGVLEKYLSEWRNKKGG